MADRMGRPQLMAVRRFDMRELWRVGLWGVAAALAVTLAAFAATTHIGTQRIILAVNQARGVADPSVQTTRTTERAELRRLTETVRALTADRDRLLVRLSALERNLDDMTGSIGKRAESQPREPNQPAAPQPSTDLQRDADAIPPAAFPAPTRAAEPPERSAVAVNAPPASAAPTETAPAAPPPATAARRPEFGIDLGGATTIDGLRGLWATARSRHGAALQGLRPVVNLREGSRGVELRLIAGPFASAGNAARACAAITPMGALCQPAVFEGQRLAPRESRPAPNQAAPPPPS